MNLNWYGSFRQARQFLWRTQLRTERLLLRPSDIPACIFSCVSNEDKDGGKNRVFVIIATIPAAKL